MSDLVARWAAGDERAAEELYRACYTKVRRCVEHAGLPGADAEDLAQEALIEGLRELKQGKRPSHLTKWFKGIARHLVAKKPRVVTTDREPADPRASSAESVVVRREMKELLGRSLEGLSELDREVLDLTHRAGLSRKEIAERLDVPVENVHARIGRAMDRLRGALATHFTSVVRPGKPPVSLAEIRALRPLFREAVEARHVRELGEVEAALSLGIPETTLRARLQSAYELLGRGRRPDFSSARREAAQRPESERSASSSGNGSKKL
jgi:RNA polymerase sigma-70 factor (ECF subfamily)